MIINTEHMNAFIKHTLMAIFVLGTFVSYAQYDVSFTQYMFNPLIYNPAYAGNNDDASITFINRAQWAGIQGAPYSAALSAHSKSFEEELGLGISVLHDRLGVERNTSLSLDASYHMQIGVHKLLAFGLRGSMFSYNTDLSELVNNQDDPLLQGGESSISGNLGLGLFLYAKNYYVGLSMPSTLTPKLTEDNSFSDNNKSRNMYLASGYVYSLSPSLKLKPSILIKSSVERLVPVTDLNLSLLLNELFWIGGFYRSTQEIGIIFSTHSIKNMKIGYSFEYPLSTLNTNSIYGSHEIMISLAVTGKKTKFSSPRYY